MENIIENYWFLCGVGIILLAQRRERGREYCSLYPIATSSIHDLDRSEPIGDYRPAWVYT